MHRFFIKPELIKDSRAPLQKEEAQHALRVLRLRDGECVQALDGRGGIFEGILRLEGDGAFIEIGKALSSREADVSVTLYMGIPKGDKLDFLAQKLTELGVKRLVPVRMERCVAKIEDKEQEKKLARIRKISLEAQKQCGRALEIEILPPMNFSKAVQAFSTHETKLLLWEEAEDYRIRDAYREQPESKDIACVVGPEGGITKAEAEKLMEAGAKNVTLGPRILRAETAAVASCAVIMSLWGDI